MRMQIKKTLEKPKNKTLRRLGNLTEKLRHRKNVANFARNNNFLTMELNQIQTHSNSKTRAELEQQQCNGLIYANIVRFR
jgi:hypothetical protein